MVFNKNDLYSDTCVSNYSTAASHEEDRRQWQYLGLSITLLLLILLGVIGNALTVTVFMKRDMRHVPAYCAFIFLAVTDIIVLACVIGYLTVRLLDVNVWIMLPTPLRAIYFTTASMLLDFSGLLVLGTALSHCACACCCCHLRTTCYAICKQPCNVIWLLVMLMVSILTAVPVGWCAMQTGLVCSQCKTVLACVFLVKALLSVGVSLVLCIVFACRLCTHRPSLPSYTVKVSRDVNVASKLTNTILALCLLFFLTHFPIVSVFTLEVLDIHLGLMRIAFINKGVVFDVAVLLWCVNFSIKFIVYQATAPDFRKNLPTKRPNTGAS